jgi:hypothetical protein
MNKIPMGEIEKKITDQIIDKSIPNKLWLNELFGTSNSSYIYLFAYRAL